MAVPKLRPRLQQDHNRKLNVVYQTVAATQYSYEEGAKRPREQIVRPCSLPQGVRCHSLWMHHDSKL